MVPKVGDVLKKEVTICYQITYDSLKKNDVENYLYKLNFIFKSHINTINIIINTIISLKKEEQEWFYGYHCGTCKKV